jgi:hypothetical protein
MDRSILHGQYIVVHSQPGIGATGSIIKKVGGIRHIAVAQLNYRVNVLIDLKIGGDFGSILCWHGKVVEELGQVKPDPGTKGSQGILVLLLVLARKG